MHKFTKEQEKGRLCVSGSCTHLGYLLWCGDGTGHLLQRIQHTLHSDHDTAPELVGIHSLGNTLKAILCNGPGGPSSHIKRVFVCACVCVRACVRVCACACM